MTVRGGASSPSVKIVVASSGRSMLGESHDAEQWKVTCPDLPANLVFEADEITATESPVPRRCGSACLASTTSPKACVTCERPGRCRVVGNGMLWNDLLDIIQSARPSNSADADDQQLP